jgi:hypothetical protein
MKIILEHFVGRENSFKLTILYVCLHQDNNDNGVTIVNFATSKNLVPKSTIYPHPDIHVGTQLSIASDLYRFQK